LKSIHDLLVLTEDKYWANSIAEDMLLWEKEKNVGHHLSSYGKEGLNDLCICILNGHKINSDQEVWANFVLGQLTNISHQFANQIIKNKIPTLDNVKKESWHMLIQGSRCRNCGFSLIPKRNIDYYIAPKIVEYEILSALEQNNLEHIIEMMLTLSLPIIEIERTRIKNKLKESGISYSEDTFVHNNNMSIYFMRPCKNCGSNDTIAFYWKEKQNKFISA